MANTVDCANTFSLGAQIGGPEHPTREVEQRLRHAFNKWTGKYTQAIGKFAFILRVDGSLCRYTEMWNISGAQRAKRKRDSVEVEIGVPENWWQADGLTGYKSRLANAIEEGLHSMIGLLERNHHAVDAVALLGDWEKIKRSFLSGSDQSD